MASNSSMAIRIAAAMRLSKDAIRTIWGEEFVLPQNHRNLAMLAVIQWETIANYLDCKAQGVNTTVEIDLDNIPEGVTLTVPAEMKKTRTRRTKAK